MRFDDRWKELARQARTTAPSVGLPADLARRARRVPAEPIPFLPARWAWGLGAAAALLSAALLPLAVRDAAMPPLVATVPAPPRLPPPPAVESPGHYLALVRTAWKDLAP